MTQTDLSRLKLKDFLKQSVSASNVAEYGYCPATISNKLSIGEIKTPIMLEGSKLHEEDAQKILPGMKLRKMKAPETLLELLVTMNVAVKAAMRNRSSLVNSDETRMYWAILPELGCIGFPDLVDCTKGPPVVVERKKRLLGKIPSEPYDSHKLQLAIYMLSLERIGLNPECGILEYVKPATGELKRFEIRLDQDLRKKTLDAVEAIKGIINGKEPLPTKNPVKCTRCKYSEKCTWSLARGN